MPPELPNEQELTLKKRARRRLVGAIALVLLMIIVLPQVLQDRALLAQPEPIKITMPELAAENHAQVNAVTTPVKTPVDNTDNLPSPHELVAVADTEARPDVAVEPISDKSAAAKVPEVKKPEIKKIEAPVVVADAEKKSSVPAPEAKPAPETKSATEVKDVQKSAETFTVQVGVYSDMANVKRLQDQLKQAGFSTHTEKVKTPKGESVRLKAGSYASRQDAVNAQAKIKEIGLSGIVVGNE